MQLFSSLHFMSSLDNSVVIYLNSFAHRSRIADSLISGIIGNDSVEGAVFITVYWWMWFSAPESHVQARSRKQDTLIYTLLICIPAVLIARLMALLLPFRLRPIYNPELHLRSAFTLVPGNLESWSSFPSDHAVLFFALATGFYLVSRRIGWLMYCYTVVFIALPRVYLGIHYLSDILVGAFLGTAIVSTAQIEVLRRVVNWPAQRLLAYSLGLFYASLFQLSFQTAVLYEPLRHVARFALEVFRITTIRL